MKFTPHSYSGALHVGDIATCIYLPILLVFLHYSQQLFKLGRYENVYIVIFLASAEVLKYAAHYFKNKAKQGSGTGGIFKSMATLLIAFGAFYLIAVLLGAPLLSNVEETAMFALILTTIAVFPLVLHLGPDTTINLIFHLTASYKEDEEVNKLFLAKLRLTTLGAWSGAVVVPLDWNRPWQEWPIPCCIGGICGYIAASAFTSFLQFVQMNGRPKKSSKYGL